MSFIQQNISNFVESLNRLGLNNIVISPGSRNAPIANVFSQHDYINCYSRIDERSAGFVALGMAIELKEPIALLCTSGSALVNYFPAICEAYYQNVPLIIISADRPPEDINQWEGQSIMQENIFGKHVLASYNLNDAIDTQICSDSIENQVIDGFKKLQKQQGPLHYNISLREPIYANSLEKSTFNSSVQKLEKINLKSEACPIDIGQYKKILWINGFDEKNDSKTSVLKELIKKANFPILSDVVSGLYESENIKGWEYSIRQNGSLKSEFKPDLIVSTGKGILSKELKLFLKDNKAKMHLHISDDLRIENPFQIPTATWKTDLENACSHILGNSLTNSDFLNLWKSLETNDFNDAENEFKAIKEIVLQLNKDCILHVSNSMPIRYVSWIKQYCIAQEIRCNRGVSGIDGCSSTAVGSALVSKKKHVLITGDVAFLYDKNAWWSVENNENLCCIIINNNGGQIFNKINGAKDLAEKEKFLITHHFSNIKDLARHYQLSFLKIDSNKLSDISLSHHLIELDIM